MGVAELTFHLTRTTENTMSWMVVSWHHKDALIPEILFISWNKKVTKYLQTHRKTDALESASSPLLPVRVLAMFEPTPHPGSAVQSHQESGVLQIHLSCHSMRI